MALDRLALLLAASTAVALTGFACASPAEDDSNGGEDNLTQGPNTDRWVYNGMLPHLESPSIVVAQTPHTLRITGALPADYDKSKLPFYAKDSIVEEGGKSKVSIVYPIATGAEVNHQPDEYVTERVFPRRTDSSAPWGGFPFISYVNDDSPFKGIAFHGPITAQDGQWFLKRGPVSHGCNRMQGEHVVELAHLIGVNMTTKTWSGDTILRNVKIPVKVIRNEFDQFQGQNVDVDYPALPQVKRPKDNVKMWKAWSSNDFPAWVCRVDPKKVDTENIPADYCTTIGGQKNKFDGVAGPK